MASTGNTQGMRLSKNPPTSAPKMASVKPNAVVLAAEGFCDALALALALSASALAKAGEISAGAAGVSAGQAPCTGVSISNAGALGADSGPAAITQRMVRGLSPRSSDTGIWAVQTAPCQFCVQSLP